MPAEITVRADAADSLVAVRLVEAMIAEMGTLYGPGEMPTSARPDELGPPHGAFVVLYEDGEPVAGGGVKRLEERIGEAKRMYVVPEARSRGLARRLLAGLEDAARALGYTRLRLDTGAHQPHARALYESAGYRPVPDYNDNPLAAYWGEKRL